ncbi:MAG: hypothetical protein D6767_04035 [Candidatus Hydrogenedentota bacterium]|nr:MAG: hypothetical protein D6767_04035 [Candidatus Hydrogenedentota bacterium]
MNTEKTVSVEKEDSKQASWFFALKEVFLWESNAYFRSPLAWIILFFVLFINGLLGYWSLKHKPQSSEALQLIFYSFSGTSMIAGVLLGMRLFAEEKARGTHELLLTSPITEMQLILGKYLASLFFLFIIMIASLPVPLSAMIFGDAHIGHVIAGNIGVFLIGAAAISVSLFYSTLTSIQILAAVMGGANVVLFLLMGFFSPFIESPMKEIVREFSFYVHYMEFEQGVITLKNVLFFFSVISFYVYLTGISLRASRWR